MEDKNQRKIIEIIEKCPIFQGIDISKLHPVYREFRRKEEISDIQDGIPCVGMIGVGEADVYTISDEMTQPNVSTQHEGSIFGICNIYLPDAMPTKLVCKVHCEVVFISKEEFKGLIQENSVFQERYLTLCNRKIMYLAQKIELMGISSCKSKLACYLLRNASAENVVVLDTSKEQFAKYLNVSRASLFRTIADFTANNLITSEGDVFQLIDKEGLCAIRKGDLKK